MFLKICEPYRIIMKKLAHLAVFFAASLICPAAEIATPAPPSPAVPLWEAGKVPLARGTTPRDTPTLQAYLPAKKADSREKMAAVIICPGGGYTGLADGHEGKDYAQFFNLHGVAGFVLRYRLGAAGYRHPVMLTDAARALRTVRANAEKYGIDPNRIGIMGSSAGGHLAATLLTKFDAGKGDAEDPIERVSSRPDFGILCYPVISMKRGITHQGSRDNLLGRNASEEMVNELSAELQVTKETPKCFLWHTAADNTVPVQNSLLFASALAEKKVPFSMHILQEGAHGLGLKAQFPYEDALPWAASLLYWLKENKIITE